MAFQQRFSRNWKKGAAMEKRKEKVRGARRGCDEREEEKGMLSCAKEQEENEGRK